MRRKSSLTFKFGIYAQLVQIPPILIHPNTLRANNAIKPGALKLRFDKGDLLAICLVRQTYSDYFR